MKELKKIAYGFAAVTNVFILSLAGMAVGYFVDRHVLPTWPWLTIILLFFGMALGFYRLYRSYL